MSLPPLGLAARTRSYLAVEPVDMRKQYDGLNPDIGIRLSGVSVVVATLDVRNLPVLAGHDGYTAIELSR